MEQSLWYLRKWDMEKAKLFHEQDDEEFKKRLWMILTDDQRNMVNSVRFYKLNVRLKIGGIYNEWY